MDLLQTILNAKDGRAVDDLGRNLGLDRDQTVSAIQGLMPALAGAMATNAAKPGGLENLESALTSGGHSRYLDDPAQVAQPEAIQDGNGILGHLFGSKDVSRQVASGAAAQTGIGADVLKRMLPMLATLAMGALAHRATRSPSGNVQLNPSGGGGGLMDMLGPLLGGSGGGLGGMFGGGGGSQGGGIGDLLGGLFKR
jgi:hypothetical protein